MTTSLANLSTGTICLAIAGSMYTFMGSPPGKAYWQVLVTFLVMDLSAAIASANYLAFALEICGYNIPWKQVHGSHISLLIVAGVIMGFSHAPSDPKGVAEPSPLVDFRIHYGIIVASLLVALIPVFGLVGMFWALLVKLMPKVKALCVRLIEKVKAFSVTDVVSGCNSCVPALPLDWFILVVIVCLRLGEGCGTCCIRLWGRCRRLFCREEPAPEGIELHMG